MFYLRKADKYKKGLTVWSFCIDLVLNKRYNQIPKIDKFVF